MMVLNFMEMASRWSSAMPTRNCPSVKIVMKGWKERIIITQCTMTIFSVRYAIRRIIIIAEPAILLMGTLSMDPIWTSK